MLVKVVDLFYLYEWQISFLKGELVEFYKDLMEREKEHRVPPNVNESIVKNIYC